MNNLGLLQMFKDSGVLFCENYMLYRNNDFNLKSEGDFINMQNEMVKKESIKLKFFKRYHIKNIIIGVVIVVGIVAVVIGFREFVSFESKTTKIGFEDIGELATQTAYCTELSVTDKSRNLFGVTIPFTQSKYIYSYDIVIKAGFDFEDIKWEENGTSIEVKLAEVKVLSSEIDLESFKIYHEDESIFTKIPMTENNEGMKDLKQKAQEDAIANGLLDNARINVETILTGFFGNVYDLEKYKIIFKDK